MQTIRVFESFAGYGSQLKALRRLEQAFPDQIKVVPVGISEIDAHAIKAYHAVHGEDVKNYGDISKIDWAQVPDFDLFTYSSPCQDFSSAGLQRGGEKGSGTRSSLLWECERAIAEKRPKWLLMENVAALVSGKFIKLFNKWQRTLEKYGYRNFAQVLNAKDYGVPQNRERIFMVSILDEAARYYFPKPIPLTKRLKDVLEPVVDECYYINDIQVQKVLNSSFAQERNRLQQEVAGACLARDYKDPKLVCVGSLQGGVWDARNDSTKRVYSADGIAPTQHCCEGGGLQTKIVEPTIIHKVGDRGNGYYSEKDYAFTVAANPMSDTQQLVKEPIK